MQFFRSRTRRVSLLTLTLAALVSGTSRRADADETFFAEDINRAGDSVRITPVNSFARRDDFLARLTGAVTDTLETQTAGAPGPYTLAFGTLSGTGPSTGMVSVPTGTDGGRFPLSGSLYYRQADEIEPAPRYAATLLLNTPQRAFGFLATDYGDSGFLEGTRPTVTVTFLDSTTRTFEVPSSVLGTDTTGSVTFFGLLTDNPFSRIDIVNGTGSRTAGYDDFTAAPTFTAVAAPEPASIALIAGLLPFAAAWRRRLPQRRRRDAGHTALLGGRSLSLR